VISIAGGRERGHIYIYIFCPRRGLLRGGDFQWNYIETYIKVNSFEYING